MELFPELVADVTSVPEKVPPRQDVFIVLAVTGEVWTIPSRIRNVYLTREAAVQAARELPDCWTCRRVVRIPGEQP